MNELVREIEEDIRSERLNRVWNSFGKLMVGVSVAVVLGTIGVVVMQDRSRTQAMEGTTQLIKGIDRINIEDYKGAIPVFDALAKQNGGAYYGLAMLRKAQAQEALSDRDGMNTTLRELAQNDPVFGDLAKLLAPVDDSKPIEPSKGSPFYYAHSEAKGWQLLRKGKKNEAVSTFVALYKDDAIPGSMRQRLNEVLQHIAPEKLPETLSDKVNIKVKQDE